MVRKHVDADNSELFTDEYKAYNRMSSLIKHQQVNHSIGQYSVNGVSTNSIESFWATVKRGIVGQFHKVSKKYLNAYLDEFCYRFNNRKNNNVFEQLLMNAVR